MMCRVAAGTIRSAIAGLVVVAGALAVTGCGSKLPESVTDDRGSGLTNLGEMYALYQLEHKQPPKSYQELNEMPGAPPGGLMEATPEKVVVFWGASMPDVTGEGPSATRSDQILAYSKEVPEQGGWVLYLDRRVEKLSAEQFKAASKAGAEPAKK